MDESHYLNKCPFCSGKIIHAESDDPNFYFECDNQKDCGILFTVKAGDEYKAFDKINRRIK